MAGGQNIRIDRIGGTKLNRSGNRMTIIKYNSANDIIVEFDDGFRIKTKYERFNRRILEKEIYQ